MFDCTFMSIEIKEAADGSYTHIADMGLFSARGDVEVMTGNVPLDHWPTQSLVCSGYNPEVVDVFSSGERAGRTFGMIGYVMHTIALVLIMLVELCTLQRTLRFWFTARILLVISLLSSFFTFSFLSADYCNEDTTDCSLSAAGMTSIGNILMIMALLYIARLVDVPTRPMFAIRLWRNSDNDGKDTPSDNQSSTTSSALRYSYLGLALVAWFFWNISIFNCTFLAVGAEGMDYAEREVLGIYSQALRVVKGDGSAGKIYTCQASPYSDAAFNTSRFFSALGYVMHTMAFVIIFFVELFVSKRTQKLWLIGRGLWIASSVCLLLVFAVFGSNRCKSGNTCVPYAAGIIAIWNILVMIGLVCVSWMLCEPSHPVFFVAISKDGNSDDNPGNRTESACNVEDN